MLIGFISRAYKTVRVLGGLVPEPLLGGPWVVRSGGSLLIARVRILMALFICSPEPQNAS